MKYLLHGEVELTELQPQSQPTTVPLPTAAVEQYLRQGAYWAGRHFAAVRSGDLAATYYDAMEVYHCLFEALAGLPDGLGLHDATLDAFYSAVTTYRDNYVFANQGKVPAYWAFTDGLTRHYLEVGDEKSKEAVLLLANNAAYAPDTTPTDELKSTLFSREVAYTLNNYINAERCGAPVIDRRNVLKDLAFQHLINWFTTAASRPYVRPFMVALTIKSLISAGHPWFSLVIDAEELWKLYDHEAGAFPYTDRVVDGPDDIKPAPDLNLLIAPVYAWLYKETKDPKWAEIADTIFIDGVRGAYLGNPKQFNQNYFWGFKYLEWRKA